MREGLVYKSSNPSHDPQRNEYMDSKADALAMCHILQKTSKYVHPLQMNLNEMMYERRGCRRVGFWCIYVVIHCFIQTWVQPVTGSHQY
mgnify:CR=1 FL=1